MSRANKPHHHQPHEGTVPSIRVDTSQQLLTYNSASLCLQYPVSTGRNGTGQESGSGKTPLGAHYIRAKIGADLPTQAVLVGRRFTGEVYSSALGEEFPGRDWILGRILWLSGLEPGYNRLGHVDTMRRYIYIHGTPESEPMGVPLSHGCIRMRPEDVVGLFDLVTVGVRVDIV